jgi:hypothetical protein
MSTTTISLPAIRSIEFLNSSIMFVHLANDRTFLVPLDSFPSIRQLTAEEKRDYEIIDETNLSFLALDDIYSVSELLGFPS